MEVKTASLNMQRSPLLMQLSTRGKFPLRAGWVVMKNIITSIGEIKKNIMCYIIFAFAEISHFYSIFSSKKWGLPSLFHSAPFSPALALLSLQLIKSVFSLLSHFHLALNGNTLSLVLLGASLCLVIHDDITPWEFLISRESSSLWH